MAKLVGVPLTVHGRPHLFQALLTFLARRDRLRPYIRIFRVSRCSLYLMVIFMVGTPVPVQWLLRAPTFAHRCRKGWGDIPLPTPMFTHVKHPHVDCEAANELDYGPTDSLRPGPSQPTNPGATWRRVPSHSVSIRFIHTPSRRVRSSGAAEKAPVLSRLARLRPRSPKSALSPFLPRSALRPRLCCTPGSSGPRSDCSPGHSTRAWMPAEE